jgi:hypothetical protein
MTLTTSTLPSLPSFTPLPLLSNFNRFGHVHYALALNRLNQFRPFSSFDRSINSITFMPSITFITNIYVGAFLFFKSVQIFIRELSYSMPDLPVSGPWSAEELQLLQEVANYWATGTVDPGNGNQKVIDWDTVVQEINKDSKRYFISNWEYTFEECYDEFVLHWVNNSRGNCLPKLKWTAQEIELMEEASVTCPRRGNLGHGGENKLVPDFEELKIFMNREAFKRGIRRRYYTIAAVEYAYRKKCIRISSAQEQAPRDLINLQEANIAISQTASIHAEFSSRTNEGIINGDAAAQEGGQLQLHVDRSISHVDLAIVEQIINLPLRPGGGGKPTLIDQVFAWTRPSHASASTVVILTPDDAEDLWPVVVTYRSILEGAGICWRSSLSRYSFAIDMTFPHSMTRSRLPFTVERRKYGRKKKEKKTQCYVATGLSIESFPLV